MILQSSSFRNLTVISSSQKPTVEYPFIFRLIPKSCAARSIAFDFLLAYVLHVVWLAVCCSYFLFASMPCCTRRLIIHVCSCLLWVFWLVSQVISLISLAPAILCQTLFLTLFFLPLPCNCSTNKFVCQIRFDVKSCDVDMQKSRFLTVAQFEWW